MRLTRIIATPIVLALVALLGVAVAAPANALGVSSNKTHVKFDGGEEAVTFDALLAPEPDPNIPVSAVESATDISNDEGSTLHQKDLDTQSITEPDDSAKEELSDEGMAGREVESGSDQSPLLQEGMPKLEKSITGLDGFAGRSTAISVPCTPETGLHGTAAYSVSVECVLSIGPGQLASDDLSSVVDEWDIQKIVFTDATRTQLVGNAGGYFTNFHDLRIIENISNLNVIGVTKFSNMFSGLAKLQALDLKNWNVSNATDFYEMFEGATSLRELDLSQWNVSGVRDMSYMFRNASSLTKLNLGGWNTTALQRAYGMFSGVSMLKSLDVKHFEMKQVTFAFGMFQNMSSLEKIDLSGWDTRNFTSMGGMFAGAVKLSEVNIEGWDSRNVVSIDGMFSNTHQLASLKGLHFDTRNVTSARCVWNGDTRLLSVDLSTWDLSAATSKEVFCKSNIQRLTLGTKSAFSASYDSFTFLPKDSFLRKWQAVGAGTPDNPTGDWQGSSFELSDLARAGKGAGVYVWQPGSPPKIARSNLSDRTVTEGDTVEFVIDVEGKPTPEVHWTVDVRGSGWQQQISDDGFFTVSNSGRKVSFIATEDHNGSVFSARIENELGVLITDPAVLVVNPKEQKPKIVSSYYDGPPEEGGVLSWSVQYQGFPEPKFDLEIYSAGEWRTLPVQNLAVSRHYVNFELTLSESMNGLPTRVRLENKHGVVFSEPTTLRMNLWGSYPPKFATDPISQTVRDGGKASFEVSMVNGNYPEHSLSWEYRAGAPAKVDEPWYPLPTGFGAVHAGGTVLEITAREYMSGYQFRARADSVNGTTVSVGATMTVTQSEKLHTSRIAGENRVVTNSEVLRQTMKYGAPLFVATAFNFPDALSVGPAVAQVGGALVLTSPEAMEEKTLQLIREKNPSAIYVIGQDNAVSGRVTQQLKGATGVTPIRIAGADRFATSAAIAKKFFSNGQIGGAFVATGTNYPDALSAASAGGALNYPVLLVNGTDARAKLHPDMVQLLKSKKVTNLQLVGGVPTISNAVKRNIEQQGFSTVGRISGADRFATNMQVNAYVDKLTPNVKKTGVWIATGMNFPDALSAAAPAGNRNQTQRLVLSNGVCVSKPVVSSWVKGSSSQVRKITLLGDTKSLQASVQKLQECTS